MTQQVYQRYVPGQQIGDFSAHRQQNAADEIRQAGNINTGPGLQLSKTPSGTSIRLDLQQRRVLPSGLKAKLVTVKSIGDNTLICKTVQGVDLEVALPVDLQVQDYRLRKRSFKDVGGRLVEITYTNTSDRQGRLADVRFSNVTTRIDERIAPPYAFEGAEEDNDKIIAVLVGDSITRVPGVPWMDWNNAARAWAELE